MSAAVYNGDKVNELFAVGQYEMHCFASQSTVTLKVEICVRVIQGHWK